MPPHMVDSITSKSFLMFQCQVNRFFVVGMSFTGSGRFTITITDREGQLRWKDMPLFSDKKHVDVFLRVFSFLMFGEEFDVGLDPNFEFDGSGKLLAITVDYRRFVVEKMVYELSCIVGRATRVWVVRDDNERYALKDLWIQDHYVDSEVIILQKMNKVMENDKKVKQLIKEFRLLSAAATLRSMGF